MANITSSSPRVIPIYRDGNLLMRDQEGQEFVPGSIGLLLSGLLTQNPPKPPEIPLRLRINEQRDLLIKNTTLFLTIQYLWEKSYGQSFNYSLYTQMLSDAKDKAAELLKKSDQSGLSKKEKEKKFLKTTENQLKIIFFDQINAIIADRNKSLNAQLLHASIGSYVLTKAGMICLTTIDFFRACKARMVYSIFNRVIQPCVKAFVNTHIDMLRDYKDKMSQDGFNTLKNELISNLDDCLTVLNEAYTWIATKEPSEEDPARSIPKRIAARLSQPAANQGRTSEELFKEFAKTLIISTLGQYKGRFVSWIINKFIQPGEIAASLTQTTAGSMRDNKEYAHALNTSILKQLNQVKELLIANTETSASFPISKERERQLSNIIQQLLELYHKSECSTVDELRTVVNRTKPYSELEIKHIPSLMKSLTLQISDFLESHVNTKQIDELTLKILTLTNDSFEPVINVDTQVMKATEEQIMTTMDEVMELFFDKIIREKAFGLNQKHLVYLIKKATNWTYIDIPETKKTIESIRSGLVKIAMERTTYLCALSHLVMIPHIKAMTRLD